MKKICLLISLIFTCLMVFGEHFSVTSDRGNYYLGDNDKPPIKIVNNSRYAVRVDGYSGSIQPGKFATINARSVDVYADGTVVFSGDTNSTTLYINNVSGSNRSSSGSSARSVMCTTCAGSGKCSYCNGRGYIYTPKQKTSRKVCPHCSGKGKCTACNGKGSF